LRNLNVCVSMLSGLCCVLIVASVAALMAYINNSKYNKFYLELKYGIYDTCSLFLLSFVSSSIIIFTLVLSELCDILLESNDDKIMTN
jgi:hypothetical protein